MAKHNKEDILDKGIELMRRNGYYGTGIQQVLKACSIPKGSFYHFFASKQDFAIQAVEKYANKSISALQTISAKENLSSVEKLKAFFSDQLHFYEQKNFEMTCLMSIISFEVGAIDPEITSKVAEKFNKIKSIMAEIIEKGQRDEGIQTRNSPAELADFLVNGFNGALITMKYEQSARAIQQFLDLNLSLIKEV